MQPGEQRADPVVGHALGGAVLGEQLLRAPLHPAGGLLKPLILPWKLGLGGKLGPGDQYVPWISLADWIDAVRFVLAHDVVSSAVIGPRTPGQVEASVQALGSEPYLPPEDLMRAKKLGLLAFCRRAGSPVVAAHTPRQVKGERMLSSQPQRFHE